MASSYKRNGQYRYGRAVRTHSHGNGNGKSGRAKLPPQLLNAYGVRNGRRGINRGLLAVLGVLAGILLLVPTIALAGGGLYYAQTSDELAPRLEQLDTYEPFQTSRILDRNGNLLYEYVVEGRRDMVPIEDVSPFLIDATVAIEDKNFWTNTGVDYLGIVRSAYLNFQADETVSGASTITQQFVKLVILSQEEQQERYTRKIKEAILAQQLTQEYSKSKILELYVNEVNYGNRSYGIQAAAREYFGVDAKDLDLNQSSLLAGIPQQPTNYNLTLYMTEDRVLPVSSLRLAGSMRLVRCPMVSLRRVLAR